MKPTALSILTHAQPPGETRGGNGQGIASLLVNQTPHWAVLLALLLTLEAPAPVTGQQPAPAPLTSVQAVRDLPPAESETEQFVQLRGVVTWLREFGQGLSFIVHDGRDGIYVDAPQAVRTELLETPVDTMTNGLTIGSLVELEGVVRWESLAPFVVPKSIRPVGTAPLPKPIPVSLPMIYSGAIDCQRVIDEGVVIENQKVPGREHDRDLYLLTVRGRTTFRIDQRLLPESTPLSQARVRVTGSCMASFNARGEIIGIRIEGTQPTDLQILQPAPADLFAAREVPLNRLRHLSSRPAQVERVKSRGVVLARRTETQYFLHSNGIGIVANCRLGTVLEPGTLVEVSGIVNRQTLIAHLDDAILRPIGTAPLPPAVPVTAAQLLKSGGGRVQDRNSEDWDIRRVTLEGTVVDFGIELSPLTIAPREADHDTVVASFLIQAEGSPKLIRVHLGRATRADLSSDLLRPGTRVRCTGVTFFNYGPRTIPTRPGNRPTSVSVVVPSLADVKLLQPAPWWTPHRIKVSLWSGGLLLAGGGLWAGAVQLELRRKSAQLRKVAEDAGALAERHRLSREIHDSLEQYLAGVAMQLDGVVQAMTENPLVARDELERARGMLTHARKEARQSVWELRSDLMKPGGLSRALQILTALSSSPCAVVVEVTGEVRRLAERTEMNLLRIAQEAVNNALKHARASRISVHLEFAPEQVTLTVRDNGVGFDTQADYDRECHFGLLGMRERCQQMHARLSLESARGQGTRIRVVLDLPIEGGP